MLDELLPIIVEVLIANEKAATLNEVSDFCGYDKHEVSKGLNILTELSLLRLEEKNGEKTYVLIRNIKPIHLARAAQAGLDLTSFSDFFIFTEKEKAMALELTTKSEKIRNLDVTKRKPLLQKRSYFKVDKVDDIGNNLLVFFESTNLALYEYIEKLAEKDGNLKILLNLNEEAERSVKEYLNNLK